MVTDQQEANVLQRQLTLYSVLFKETTTLLFIIQMIELQFCLLFKRLNVTVKLIN